MNGPTSWEALADLTDRILEDCEDDIECLMVRLSALDDATRNELLVSDLLNAWQVFYFSFRTDPGDLLREKLELEPASELPAGIRLGEIDLLELIFTIRDNVPWIVVWDGEKTVASFSGRSAYADALDFCTGSGPAD